MTSGPLKAIVVLADEALREETLNCVNTLPVRIVGDQKQLEHTEEFLDRIETSKADVVLLQGDLLSVPLEDFVRRLKLTSSQPAIFILQREAVAAKILEAIQGGAREYLCPPLCRPLKEAFERLGEVRSEQVLLQQKKLGKIFGFISAKGGCGATTFASHVATAAARQTGKPLLLADLDFDAGLLRFILKTKAPYSVRDALDNMHRMDASYWNALVTRHGNQLDFIAAPEELTGRSLPDSRQLARLLRFIRATYPVTVLDFGRCYSAAALDSLPEMECLYLLTTQDIDAFDHAKDFLRMVEERGKGRVKVLLNKVSAKQKPDPAGIRSFLGITTDGVYTNDSDGLYEAWSEGRLLSDSSDLGRQMAELAKSMLEEEVAPTPTPVDAAAADAAGLAKFFPFSFMRRSRA